jgi:hypothetical protein
MTGRLLPGPPWADLVFHVLAHVTEQRRFASSLGHLPYRAFCERHLGRAAARSLAEDVDHLTQVLTSHELLAQLQWMAFLFHDPIAARSVGARELTELLTDRTAGDAVVNPRALRGLSGVEAQAELLRAAAELEAPHHARLPPAGFDLNALSRWLRRVAVAAPRLRTMDVRFLRALTQHGRVVAPVIYIGVPSEELGVEVPQVAVQAAHEATVVEVAEAARGGAIPLGEREVEHVALLVFAERAGPAGLGEEHGRWWSALALPAPGEVRESLEGDGRRVLEALEKRAGAR